MKTSFRLIAAAAALALCACSQEEPEGPAGPVRPIDPDQPSSTFTITATLPASTRIGMEDDGVSAIKTSWESGDKIYVINALEAGAQTAYPFTAVSIAPDGKSATFAAPADYPAEAVPAFALNMNTWNFTTIDPGNFTWTHVMETSSNLTYCPYYAYYDAGSNLLTFRPLTGILKLTVTLPDGAAGQTIMQGDLNAQDASSIFYTGGMDFTSGSPVRAAADRSYSIPLSGFKMIPADRKVALYVGLVPGTDLSNQPLVLNLWTDQHYYTATLRGGAIEAGRCYPLERTATGGAFAASGTGAQSDPYLITTAGHLRMLARAVAGDNGFRYKNFRLENNITGIVTSAEDPWMPIGGTGYRRTSFEGNFDGAGHSVSGTFHFTGQQSTEEYRGFFGWVQYGSVSGLTVEGNVIYEGTGQVITLGAVCGCGAWATFTDCRHAGGITITSDRKISAGGIVGYLNGSSMSGCTQQGGTITCTGNASYVYRIGGLCGEIRNSGKVHSGALSSSIEMTGAGNWLYVGTIAGDNQGAVYDCVTVDPAVTVTVDGSVVTPTPMIGRGTEPAPCTEGH